jgi:hypothetical protein
MLRTFNQITEDEMLLYPVWEYIMGINNDDGFALQPTINYPVHDLLVNEVFTKVTMANGGKYWGMIGGVSFYNKKETLDEMFLALHVNGKRFSLGRKYERQAERNCIELGKLKAEVQLNKDEIFPIEYDVSMYVMGSPDALKGFIYL